MIKRSSEVIIKDTRLTRWGITIVAFWALVLAFLAFAKLLLITSIAQSVTIEIGVLQNWMLFGLNIFLLVTFSVSAYGLFKRYSWGRILFLWVVSIWASFNLIVLFTPLLSINQEVSQKSILSAIYYIMALVLPVLYLNLAQVKLAFQPSSENIENEDLNVN